MKTLETCKHADRRDTPIFDIVADLLSDRQQPKHGTRTDEPTRDAVKHTYRFFEAFKDRTLATDYLCKEGNE